MTAPLITLQKQLRFLKTIVGEFSFAVLVCCEASIAGHLKKTVAREATQISRFQIPQYFRRENFSRLIS